MEEFLAPKEVNTGMEVLEAEGFSETGLAVSFDPLISLDGLVAWNKNRGQGSEKGGRAFVPAPLQVLKMGSNPKGSTESGPRGRGPKQGQKRGTQGWGKGAGTWG